MPRFHAMVGEGEPITSPYFERYWLPLVGPTGTVLMRMLALELERAPEFRISHIDLARRAGVGLALANSTLERLAHLRLLERRQGSTWGVRMSVRPLDERQVRRLPECLAEQHREMPALI